MPTSEPQSTGPSFEMLLHAADDFRDTIAREVERAIADVDVTSPRAAASRSALQWIGATLHDVSLTRLVKLAALEKVLHGAVMATIRAALDTVGPPPLLQFTDAASLLSIFDQLIADAGKPRLH